MPLECRRNNSGGVLHGASRSRTAILLCPSVSRRRLPSPPVRRFRQAVVSSLVSLRSSLAPRMRDTALTRRYGAVLLAMRSLTASSSAPAAPSRT